MTTKKIEKKLSLNKETIAQLTGADMKAAQGGIVETGCVTICCNTDLKYTGCCGTTGTIIVC